MAGRIRETIETPPPGTRLPILDVRPEATGGGKHREPSAWRIPLCGKGPVPRPLDYSLNFFFSPKPQLQAIGCGGKLKNLNREGERERKLWLRR